MRQDSSARYSSSNYISILILKTDIKEPHKLQCWNNPLTLVDDIELVQTKDGGVPSLIGFNLIENQVDDFGSKLLLFQDFDTPTFQVFPRLPDRKKSFISHIPIAAANCTDVKMVKGTSCFLWSTSPIIIVASSASVEAVHFHLDAQKSVFCARPGALRCLSFWKLEFEKATNAS